jgi:hypothetical protein
MHGLIDNVFVIALWIQTQSLERKKMMMKKQKDNSILLKKLITINKKNEN